MLLLAAVAVGAGLLAQTGTPDIQVQDGTTVVALNDAVAFTPTPAGMANSKTFTVTNTGTANLLVSEAISVPQGFTLMASFPSVPDTNLPTNVPAFTIAPGASATFTVALNSATAGTFSGPVSFQTNVTGKNPFTFNVTGTVVSPPSVRYLDDTSAGFAVSSGWTTGFTTPGDSGVVPFQGSLAYAPAGTGTETATYTFTGLEPGQYRVSATWPGYSSDANNTPYTVYDGTTAAGTIQVDQTVDSAGFTDGSSAWQDLGIFTITGPTLVVKVTDNANGPVLADAVRIERVGYPGQIIDDSSPNFIKTPGAWTQASDSADFQGNRTTTTPSADPNQPNAEAQYNFTVVPGTYRVMVAIAGHSDAATNVPYLVYDSDTPLTPSYLRVDQSVPPNDLVDAAAHWKDLGFYTVSSTTLIVYLNNGFNVNGNVNADAVRIERVNTPTIPSRPDAVRFLEQATWGPIPGTADQLAAGMSFSAWLDQQFATDATSYPTLPLYNTNDNVTGNVTTSCYGDPTVSGNPARTACLRDHYGMYPLQNQFFTNAFYGDDQLRQRVAWALHKIWVISGVDTRQSAWVAPYLQIMSNNAFGNYRTHMYQVTLNAGMGKYLDMAGSTRTNPNENYPREILQLFTIGLYELNPDGTQKLDGSGNPIPTYDQNLINNITRVFTGWNLAPAPATNIPNYIDPMRLNGAATENPTNHDFNSPRPTLLRGFTLPTRTSSVANAYADLNDALDNVYSHPSVAPFICKQLIQQLVTSNPSPAYVARVSDTFNRNKTAANQMQLVVKAILLDPEARGDRKNAMNYGHLKEPVLYINNLMRMWGVASDDLTQNSDGYLNPNAVNLGQDVFRPTSVFSYFSPSKVAVSGPPLILGPEFQIQNTSTALARANFVNTAVAPNSSRTIDVVRAHGTTPNGTDPATGLPLVPTGALGTAIDLSSLLPYTTNDQVSVLIDILNQNMMHGAMSPEMKANITTAVTAVTISNPPTAAQQRKRARYAVYLVATSSQYQVQQ
jgi:uncharacterized protein (DUF1800 family)